MTSDERRNVAKALRDSFLDPTDELEAALLHAFGHTRDDAECFDLDYGAMLADLIDPTCHLDLTGVETHGNVKVRIYECSRCGRSCEEIYGKYERCPHCGAREVNDDD